MRQRLVDAPLNRLPQGEAALAPEQRADGPARRRMLDALHHGVHGALQERDLAVEGADQLAGLVHGQVQLLRQLCFAHAVHQPQANGLGSFAFDAGHVGDHLVEVGVGVVAVGLGHLLRAGQAQEGGVVHQEARLLGAEVVGRPHVAVLGEEQTTDHGADDLVARGHLLQVGACSRQAARDGAAVFIAHLVKVGVHAAVLGAVLEVGLQERAVGLVQLPGLQDHLGHGMLVRIKKALGEAWCASGCLRILHAHAVEGCGDGLGSPDIHT